MRIIEENKLKDIINIITKYQKENKDINSLFNNEATYSCLSDEDNEKINNLRSFKIKLVRSKLSTTTSNS